MEVKEILEQFQYNQGRFARQAVLAAIEKREEITPHLLQIIEDTTIRADEILKEKDDYFAHFYAFYLLSQFRERHAYPLIATFFSIPGDACERLTEDFITEDLNRVFAAVAHGDSGPVKKIIEDRSANQWARSAAIRSIVAMVAIGEHPRQEAIEYFRDLMRERLPREAEEDFDIWDTLVSAANDLYPEELYPEIKEAFEERLVNRFFVNIEDVDAVLKKGQEAVLAELPAKYPLIADTVAEMEWWACFEDDYGERKKGWERRADLGVPDPGKLPSHGRLEAARTSRSLSGPWDSREYGAAETIVRETPKLGRNDPCSCASGKKYKKCCGKAAP